MLFRSCEGCPVWPPVRLRAGRFPEGVHANRSSPAGSIQRKRVGNLVRRVTKVTGAPMSRCRWSPLSFGPFSPFEARWGGTSAGVSPPPPRSTPASASGSGIGSRKARFPGCVQYCSASWWSDRLGFGLDRSTEEDQHQGLWPADRRNPAEFGNGNS